ncbi:MAG: hypothetical protein K2N98_01270, partial [Lachnospiraceae bacterium]|nr:hypothetical protein [Lachnospiraceae bacterium]
MIVFIVGSLANETSIPDIAGNAEVMEAETEKVTQKNIMERNFILSDMPVQRKENSESLVKDEEANLSEENININDSFIQIETNGIHQLIEFPSIDITGANDVANLINEQIYNEIIPKNFGQYCNGRVDIEIHYEIEILDDKIISIHFLGYQSQWGSYEECNKGLNFNLHTGEMISLKDYYTLSDIRAIMADVRGKNEINVLNFPVDEAEIEQQIDNFIHLFDSEEYMNHTDIFFMKQN